MSISLLSRPSASSSTSQSTGAIPRSQAERLWLIAGGLTAVLLILLGYFVAISPQRSETAKVDGKVNEAKVRNTALQHRIDALRQQNKDLAKYQADLAAARLALPSQSGVSDFLRSLQSLGTKTGTDVTSLTVGQPTDASAALKAAVPAAGGTAPSAKASAPANPVVGSPAGVAKVFALAISAQVSGPPAALNKFLEQLQEVQPRAVLITQIVESDAATNRAPSSSGAPSLQLSMQAFVAPTP